VTPRPDDITPADTTSFVAPSLADALRARHPRVEAIEVGPRPDPQEIAQVSARTAEADIVVLGTTAAHLRGHQAALAATVLASGRPVVTVALRTPWDLSTYPHATTHVCTYGIQPPQMEALAAALLGEIPFQGNLPVVTPGVDGRRETRPTPARGRKRATSRR
jgi:beta-N-acetylhexosaminidase